MFQLFLQA